MKFHRRMNLTAILVTILGSRNKKKHSEFWYLTFQRYLLYKFRPKKNKPWIFLSKFRWRTILMHLLIPMCGKFTRAQLAHQIFFFIEKSFYREKGKWSFAGKWNFKVKPFTEMSFDRKLLSTIDHLTERSLTKNIFNNGHLTERSFDRTIIWPNDHLTETIHSAEILKVFFDKMPFDW
jgi:hypothetical protein